MYALTSRAEFPVERFLFKPFVRCLPIAADDIPRQELSTVQRKPRRGRMAANTRPVLASAACLTARTCPSTERIAR